MKLRLSALLLLLAACSAALVFFLPTIASRVERNGAAEGHNMGANGGSGKASSGEGEDWHSSIGEDEEHDSRSAKAVADGQGEKTIADILEGVDLSSPSERERVVEEVRALQSRDRARGAEAAKKIGAPERIALPDGRVQEVAGVDHRGQPVYFTTHNTRAAISSGANILNGAPYSLDGSGLLTAGVWDGGAGRTSHQEFGARVSAPDGAGIIDHATHVIGTMAAAGIVADAKGAAPSMPIVSYDWNSDRAEMLGAGAATSLDAIGDPSKFLVSNHSYGYVVGWNYVAGGSPFRVWEWWGDAGGAEAPESDFGMYNTYARDTDSLAAGLPYYLMVRSGGNDRSNNPAAGTPVALSPGSTEVVSYDPAIHPGGDGSYRGGYDNVSFDAVAKNVITVGAVSDAVTGGVRDPSRANVSSFSSFGPVDDGRIKPDVVSNGESLYSTTSSSDLSYGTLSGTSMAAPGVSGLAMLLAEDFVSRFGYAMRASTLKGLLIHTADDRGTSGPDYQYGWGLVDGVEAVELIRDHETEPGKKRIVEDTMARLGGAQTHTFTWDGTSPIKVTLSWTDPAGTATTVHDSRTSRLRNNLNLRVISPAGTSYYPYVMPFVGTWTQESMGLAATTGINNTDNVEQVLVGEPGEQGTWTVEVTRGNSFSADQAYSLLVNGSTVKAQASVIISDLFHTYDGTSKGVLVETDPVGLAVNTTYDGNPGAPVNAGVYQVVATIDSPLYEGSGESTMEIAKADQNISFFPMADKTFGDPPFQTGAVSEEGLSLTYSTSDPSVATVSAAGEVSIVGAGSTEITVSHPGSTNYNPAMVTQYLLVSKAQAVVGITGLGVVYDGNPKPVAVSTTPPGIDVLVTYDGTETAPTDPGSYNVYCEVRDGNYEGEAGGTLVITDAVGGVTFEDWQSSSFGEAGAGSGEFDDPDGDGVPNLAEFHLGSDPLDPDSRLTAQILEIGADHNEFKFFPVSDRGTFLLERWGELGGASDTQTFSFTRSEMEAGEATRLVPKTGNKGYYRLLYSPPQ